MFLLVSVLVLGAMAAVVNNKPIIGIVTQPNEYGWPDKGLSYIAASYVKYAEAGGVRVVPIFYNGSTEYLEQMFQATNGVLFPGGGQLLDHSQLLVTTQFFLKRSQQAFEQGDYFPVFGHCQGFELLLMAITGLSEEKCLVQNTHFAAENISLALQIANEGSTTWFRELPDRAKNTLTTTNSTMNNHHWSCPVTLFQELLKSTNLKNYRAVSTSVSPLGGEFVSMLESKTFPLYAMQFHAEKPLFEWPNERINHSSDAVEAMSWLSRFMGTELRKSNHAFSSPELESAALIYNYSPDYSSTYSTFMQVYFFDK